MPGICALWRSRSVIWKTNVSAERCDRKVPHASVKAKPCGCCVQRCAFQSSLFGECAEPIAQDCLGEASLRNCWKRGNKRDVQNVPIYNHGGRCHRRAVAVADKAHDIVGPEPIHVDRFQGQFDWKAISRCVHLSKRHAHRLVLSAPKLQLRQSSLRGSKLGRFHPCHVHERLQPKLGRDGRN